MSDTVISVLISNIAIVIGFFITGYVNSKQNKKIKEEVVSVKSEVVVVKDKVVNVHEEVNGKMETLLKTTQALQEKEKEETDHIKDILDKNGIH